MTPAVIPLNLGLETRRRVRSILKMSTIVATDLASDYVFVDEHKHHKMLKGKL